MPLSNADRQRLHRERMKERVLSPVMQQMEEWLEKNAQSLRNTARQHIEQGRDFRFYARDNYWYCSYESVRYVTMRVESAVFIYMELSGYIVYECNHYWQGRQYRLVE